METNKEIMMYVAYKGVIELIKSGEITYIAFDVFENTIRAHFDMLQRLNETEATEKQISYLSELLETAAVNDKWRNHIKLEIHRGLTYEKYVDYKDKLLQYQPENPNKSMADIHESLDMIESDPKK